MQMAFLAEYDDAPTLHIGLMTWQFQIRYIFRQFISEGSSFNLIAIFNDLKYVPLAPLSYKSMDSLFLGLS